ncbi:MAG: alkaline phosphatase D family protein [Planctomycetota bacterium]|jgi:hypothetical protein|nr:hypothetical protein [Planctomycetota bacterium]MDP6369530.1 alkaline phosphatase D family protein [Planctomycetota bacterium]MDP6839137.1 alkaline phosphatase D family protein [Planctomycetota bacterium]
MLRAFISALSLSLLALACQAPEEPPRPFVDKWAASPDRPWPGADWYANRVQDWRVHAGRVECLYGAARLAGRTLHLLTRTVSEGGEWPVEIEVDIAPRGDGDLFPDARAGLLLAMGGADTDYRATALVQQVPAPGGGLLLAIDGQGRLSLRDFSQGDERRSSWTLPGNTDFAALPLLAQSEQRLDEVLWPLKLAATWRAGRLEARATGADGASVSLALPDFGRERLAGGLSLFSARGASSGAPGFAFDSFSLRGAQAREERAFGPVLGVLYTLADDVGGTSVLRLNAQLPVLGKTESPTLTLWIAYGDLWHKISQGYRLGDGSWTVPFALADYDDSCSRPFRITGDWNLGSGIGERGEHLLYTGVLRGRPAAQEPLVLASLSCVKHQVGPIQWGPGGLWFPHAALVAAVAQHDPDMLFFAGDQIYEGDITPPDSSTEERALLDYHTKWQRFLWSFGELTRRAPTVTIPDDHDVFHGNLWGAGGIRAKARPGITAQDAGGYRRSAHFVNAVHSTLVSQLPPTRVTPRIGQGISTYTTYFSWAGVDFAVLADRMWKDSATIAVPEGKFKNGWPQAAGFDPAREADVAGARLLGAEQEEFLDAWAGRRTAGTWAKVVLSQSPFSSLHTLPASATSDAVVPQLVVPAPGEYPPDDVPTRDTDTNGWPQTPRNRAVASLAKAGALHLCGDQHLGSVGWYGHEEHRDGTVVFTSPAIANTWPRRWMPAREGTGRASGAPRYTGDHRDGFGNLITVLAAANPVDEGLEPALLHNRAPGFGIVRFDPSSEEITLEAWRRPLGLDSEPRMFADWPVTVNAQGRPLK